MISPEAGAVRRFGRSLSFGKVIGAGLLLSLAFPPFNLVPLVFVALAPFLDEILQGSAKHAWWKGYLFGLVFAIGQLHWLAQLTEKWTRSFALGWVPWTIASVLMAVYFGLFAVLAHRACAARRLWLIPFVWSGIELFRSYIPVLAFPWGLLANPLWPYPALIQPAHLGSLYLVSAWVVSVNLGLWRMVKVGSPRAFAGWGTASAIYLTLSLALYLRPTSTPTMPVTLGQVGIDLAFTPPNQIPSRVPPVVQRFDRTATAERSRLLVLSEGITASAAANSYFPFAFDPRTPILFGAQRRGGRDLYFQSAVGYDGRWHVVDKTRLVIFGEFVPARDYLPFLKAFNLGEGDLSSGRNGVQAMDLAGTRIGPLLCFEALFPDLGYRQALNGAQLLAVMSDDDWFIGSSAPDQLKSGAVWRSVETGISVVRVGSLGYSLAADPKGRLIAQLPLGQEVASTVQVPVGGAPAWLPIAFVFPALSLFACAICLVPRRDVSV